MSRRGSGRDQCVEGCLELGAGQLAVHGLCLLPPCALGQYPHPLGGSVATAHRESGHGSPQGHDGSRVQRRSSQRLWVPGRGYLRSQTGLYGGKVGLELVLPPKPPPLALTPHSQDPRPARCPRYPPPLRSLCLHHPASGIS